MNKTQVTKQLNGIKEDYKKLVKIEEFKQLKKDLKIIDSFTTKITQDNDTTTKTQKISINKNMIDNFKALANKICNAETIAIIDKATNNQIKKSFALAIFENTKNDLKLAIRTNTTKLYTYQDITKVYATFKATIENIKTNNKSLSICVDIVTNKIKFVDANAMYTKLVEEKAQERKNKVQERKNKKAKQNENKTKIKK
jgi:hypothetical protein